MSGAVHSPFDDAGTLRTVIGRHVTFDQVADAHRDVDTGHKIGSVAVVIGDQAEKAS